MARRRRAKNNLLAKMIGIAVLVNAVLLPILAQLGVFKPKKGRQTIDVKLIKLPPEKKLAQKKAAKKVAKAKPRPHPVAHPSPHTAQAHESRPNPNQPKVVASAGASGSGGPGIENNGTAQAGQVTTPTPQPAPTPAPPPSAPAAEPKPQPVEQPSTPAPPPDAPTPPPHVPVYAEAVPVTQPQPEIPDDLAGQELHTSFMGLFTVHPDGTTDVKMVKSTGNAELDEAALDAARKWTFKPGTKDGAPVESYRRLRIDVDVS